MSHFEAADRATAHYFLQCAANEAFTTPDYVAQNDLQYCRVRNLP